MLPRLRIAFLAPGVMVHELAHHVLCRLCHVRVHKAVYFRFGTPAGFVTHAVPPLFRQTLLIVLGPLLVNSTLALALFLVALRLAQAGSTPWWLAGAAAAGGLGFSIGLQAWPSAGDARNLLEASASHLRQLNLLAVVGYPAGLVILAVERGRRLGSQWAYVALLLYLSLRAGGAQ